MKKELTVQLEVLKSLQMEREMNLGLCVGRHEIPDVKGFLFPMELDPLAVDDLYDHSLEAVEILQQSGVEVLNLYVTGLTVALASVIRACLSQGMELNLYHFDRNSGNYYKQIMF